MSDVSDFTKKLSRKPYRGIMSEVARERNVTPSAIWITINHYGDIEVIARVKQKMRERDNNVAVTGVVE